MKRHFGGKPRDGSFPALNFQDDRENYPEKREKSTVSALNFGNLRLQKRFFRGKNYFSSHSLSFLIPSLLPER